MVPAGNKAKRLSSVNHTTKTIHHHHHHHHNHHHRPLSLYSKTFVLITQNLASHFISQYESAPSTFIWKEELVQYYLNLIQLLSNLSKIIPSQNTADIILQMLMTLVFLQQVKEKN